LKGLLKTKNERGVHKGRRLVERVGGERSPRGEKSQESRKVPTGTNTSGSRKGHGSRSGRKPLKRRQKAARFFGKAQEWMGRGNSSSITPREKSFEGRSQRALGAERGLQGFESFM